jgi:hypothetical protein
MSKLTLDHHSLLSARDNFRRFVQVEGGNKQKLSTLDNLFSLSIGYQNGFGNLKAAAKYGFIVDIDTVDIMALARYEVENITCACGIEAYLNSLIHMGFHEVKLMEFVHQYFIYKSVYSLWHVLTSKHETELLSQQICSLSQLDKRPLTAFSNAFNYHPGYGLWNSHFLDYTTLAKLNLAHLKDEITDLCKHQSVQYGILNVHDEVLKSNLLSTINKIRSSIILNSLASEVIEQMRSVHRHRGLMDVRAFLLYFVHYDTNQHIDNFRGNPDSIIYFIPGYLILKTDLNFKAVCLIEEETAQVGEHFKIYGASDLTHRYIATLWKKNDLQGSSTSRTSKIEWDSTLKLAEQSFRKGQYFNLKTVMDAEIKTITSH